MQYRALSHDSNAALPTGLADVRGWEVRTAGEDHKIGKVDDIILAGREARYFDVDIGGFLNPRHVLLPAGFADVDASAHVLRVPVMSKDQLKALPDYPGDPALITEAYERQVRAALGGAAAGERSFDRPTVREEVVVKKRAVADTEQVEADRKKERIDVQKRGRVERTDDQRGEIR